MNNIESSSYADSVIIRTCLGCGSHLEDTWDHTEQECLICGFAYVKEGSTDSSYSLKTLAAGVFAILAAMIAGQAMSVTQFVSTSASGSIVLNGLDGAFWIAVGSMVLATVLVVFAFNTGDSV